VIDVEESEVVPVTVSKTRFGLVRLFL
jgi:hypothetical protein